MSEPSPNPEQQARQDLIDFVNPHLEEGDGRLVEEKRIERVIDFYDKYLRRSAYRVEDDAVALLFNKVILGKVHYVNHTYGPPTEDYSHNVNLVFDDGRIPNWLHGNSPGLTVASLRVDKDKEEGVMCGPRHFASGLFVARVISGLERLEQDGKLRPVAVGD